MTRLYGVVAATRAVKPASANVARTGDVAAAADGFAHLIGYGQRTGQQTQLWTTARNAAGLLASSGHPRVAAMLVAIAEEMPGAATVGPDIVRRSSRAPVQIGDLVDPGTTVGLRAEARRLTPSGVLALASGHLAELAGAGVERDGEPEEPRH